MPGFHVEPVRLSTPCPIGNRHVELLRCDGGDWVAVLTPQQVLARLARGDIASRVHADGWPVRAKLVHCPCHGGHLLQEEGASRA